MRMIPTTPHGTHSQAEKRVFDLLRAAFEQTEDDFVAYHSINLNRHAYKRFSEIDFLICGIDGIYVLEVKGGRIGCQKGIWSYTNRYGESNPSVEGPFRQAESALYALLSNLRENLSPELPDRFHIGYAVIFPDCIWHAAGAEWDRRILADARDLRNFEQWLTQMICYWQQKDACSRKPDSGDLKALKNYLRPEFETVAPLHVQTRRVAEQIARLTEDQMALLDIVDANPRVMCPGGAGTGKTFLAMELARRWTANGDKTALVCHSPWLKRFLESRIEIPGLTVALASGISTAAARMGINRFDALVVDEGQDLLDLPNLEILDHCLKNGIDNGKWCFFYDINNQAGLFGKVDQEALKVLENTKPARVPLQMNCRNTRLIIEKVKTLLGADMGARGAAEGPDVRQQVVYSKEASSKAIEKEIHTIIEEGGLSQGELTILSAQPFPQSSASLLKSSLKAQIVILDEYSLRTFPPGRISFSEISTFKGLENEAVIVVDLPVPEKSDHPLPLHYVAMSRARAVLSLIFQK